MPAVVGLLCVELHLPGVRSLKEKRMILRRLKDRLGRFNVAIAETDHQDLWQRAALSLAAVSTSADVVERALGTALEEIERSEPGLVTRTEIDILQ